MMSAVLPNLSITYLKSAARFAQKSQKIEMDNQQFYPYIKGEDQRLITNPNLDWGKPEIQEKVSELEEEDMCYAITSVIYAWMYIESKINELYIQAKLENSSQYPLKGLPNNIGLGLAKLWEVNIQEINASDSNPDSIVDPLRVKSTLDKYQTALQLCNKIVFDKGEKHYQSINILRQLRDAMLHYKPEAWGDDMIPSKKTVSQKLEESGLKSKIKTLNPFIYEGIDNPFFPDKCFGYGCAKWAVLSSVNFIEEFSSKMGLPVCPEWEETKKLII